MPAAGDRPDLTVNAEQVLGQQVGDHNTQINYYAGRSTVTWPHRVGVVPPLAHGFQVRSESQALQRALADGSAMKGVLTLVLAGMGGIGKTQLAAAYAHEQAAQVDLLMWVTASSRESVLTVYAQAAADLVDPPAEQAAEQRADRLLGWLATTKRRWLLVLDDLADPADLNGLWPNGPTGQVLVTTRRQDASLTRSGRTVVEVGLFTEQEARAYLVERLDPTGTQSKRLAEADELIADLDRLPLALAQAGSYMLDRDLTCAQYRQRLAKRRLALVFPDDAPADEYASTVAATARTVAVAWSLSIEAANSLPPCDLALPLLAMASVLSPNGIPTSLFNAPAAISFLSQEAMNDAAADELKADYVYDALSNLQRLSLITRIDTDTVRVHALVQRATREQVDDDRVDSAARAAADALVETWPEQDYQPQYSLLAQSLRDNSDALHHARPGPLWSPDTHPVLVRSGESRSDSGLLQQAVSYWATLLDGAERALGSDHPDTGEHRNSLACAYLDAGRLTDALALFERNLTDSERLLGPEHPDTLTKRNNIAVAYQAAGRPADALPLLERNLTVSERLLGPEHPDTLTDRNNVALAYQDVGRLADALPLLERNLTDNERLLGRDHPNTVGSRNNLASAYQDAGQLANALTLIEQTLTDCERLFGADHPHALTSRGNLALAYQAAGRLDEALPLLERNVTDCERLLGIDHPSTLISRSNLAAALHAAGRPDEALPLLERNVTDCERLLGTDHPSTLISRSNLAAALHAADRPDEARLEPQAPLADGYSLQ